VPLAPEGPLRLALETSIPTLDPAAASDAVSRRITSQLFDTLVDWDPSGTTLRPEILAELPAISDDGLTLTMTLRHGPDARRFAADTCLKGQPRPVRPSDVAATLLRIDPIRHAAFALLAGRIAGLEMHRAQILGEPLGIVADDANHTLTLRLTRPQPELPAILASPMLAIVPPECITYYDGHDDAHPPFARHPVGSGPYVLDHARSELPREALLVQNPDAPPSLAPPECDRLPGASPIALTHFHDPEPALRSFQAGELAALAAGQSQFAELVADPSTARLRPGAAPPGTQLQRFPTLATTLLVFRMQDAELGQHADPTIAARHLALRRAVALAFDAVRYQRVIRNDAWATPRARVVPRGLGGAHDDAPLHRFAPPAADLEQARQILAAAGLTGPTPCATGPASARPSNRRPRSCATPCARSPSICRSPGAPTTSARSSAAAATPSSSPSATTPTTSTPPASSPPSPAAPSTTSPASATPPTTPPTPPSPSCLPAPPATRPPPTSIAASATPSPCAPSISPRPGTSSSRGCALSPATRSPACASSCCAPAHAPPPRPPPRSPCDASRGPSYRSRGPSC
jgi:ABC-type transport system substrate-binding protein